MRATRGVCRLPRLAVLVALGVLAIAPAVASAGTRRAPARAVESRSEALSVVDGKVVDVDGKAVAGVTVLATLAHPNGRVHPRVESDRDGKFHFALPPGEYVFVALHRTLAGLTPAMQVLRALDVVLVVNTPTIAT